MEASAQTLRILFLDGQERIFPNASLDMSTPGWLHITRLEVEDAPLSGIATVVAGYRLETLKGWEEVQEAMQEGLPVSAAQQKGYSTTVG